MIARVKLFNSVIYKLLVSNKSITTATNYRRIFITVKQLPFACRLLFSTQSQYTIVPMDQPESTKSKVIVRNVKDEKTLKITFTLDINGNYVLINLSRDRTECLEVCLNRLKNNIDKRKLKANKNKPGGQAKIGDLRLDIIKDGQILDIRNTMNDNAWVTGNILQVDDRKFLICVNEPQVKSLFLTKNIMAGFYVIPRMRLEFCNYQDCKYAWYRQVYKTDDQLTYLGKDVLHEIHCGGNIRWIKVAESLVYHPGNEDLGRLLKFCCLPINGSRVGFQEECISSGPVELGPGPCPFERRHEYTKDNCESQDFRFITYNILADLYADSDYSRDTLFKYCPPYALHIEYRKQLLFKELIGYNADIMCLQEVDGKVFRNDLQPTFCLTGGHFKGIYSSKGGKVAEGVAIFYRDSKFELVTSWSIELSRLVDPKRIIKIDDDNPGCCGGGVLNDSGKEEDQYFTPIDSLSLPKTSESGDCIQSLEPIRRAIEANNCLAKRFLNRYTVVQMTILRSKLKPNQLLLVANTHLYFHPDADHIRLLQGGVIVKYLEFIRDYILENSDQFIAPTNSTEVAQEIELAPILCGDFNSTPDCGLYSLVTSGDVSEALKDWKSNKEEAVEGLSLSTSLRLTSAYGTPDYTNYTLDFKGCLDYIYYSHQHLECKMIVPLPDDAELARHAGLPSEVFPSDHVSLVADFSWNSP